VLEQQKLLLDDSTKLEPIIEEDRPMIDKSPSSLSGSSGDPLVPKRKVKIVDYYTNGSGDLSTTVGKSKLYRNIYRNCIIIISDPRIFTLYPVS